MTEFVRFPSTPYLVPPSGFDVRADKVVDEEELASLLGQPLRLEEKVDGQNLGISSDGHGLQFQSRGSFVELGGRYFHGLETWIRPRAARIEAALGTQLILFGEWMTITHSIRYERLPDWFLAFDVFDHISGEFWPAGLRNELALELGLATVPFLEEGIFNFDKLLGYTKEQSQFGNSPREGIVLRTIDAETRSRRAKLVRPDFVQQIDEHWMKGRLERNRLIGM